MSQYLTWYAGADFRGDTYRVNGDFACENSYLLTDVLKKDFQFKGFVVSDWGATHSAAKASHAGLDMEQPDQIFFGDALKKAIDAG